MPRLAACMADPFVVSALSVHAVSATGPRALVLRLIATSRNAMRGHASHDALPLKLRVQSINTVVGCCPAVPVCILIAVI